jgi:protein required for attachment to host cells
MTNQHVSTSKVRILVADANKGRWFTVETPAGELIELETFAHPEARLHEREMVANNIELTTDKPGRKGDHGNGAHGRSEMGESTDPKEAEIGKFAKELAQMMDKERARGNLERLYMVAPPAFLGKLRKEMSHELKKTVVDEVSKEFSSLKAADLRKELPAFLK